MAKAHAGGASTGRYTLLYALLSKTPYSHKLRANQIIVPPFLPAPSMGMVSPKVASISHISVLIGSFLINSLYYTATDGLSLYRAWLESQVEAQKIKIQAMSQHYSIPIPQLDLNPFEFPPLGIVPPAVASTLPTNIGTANNLASIFHGKQSEVPLTLQAPRLQPAQSPHVPTHLSTKSPPSSHGNPVLSATTHEVAARSTKETFKTSATGSRKFDMSYKTTPCRHFTLNGGWCPWGDECCLYVSTSLSTVTWLNRVT